MFSSTSTGKIEKERKKKKKTRLDLDCYSFGLIFLVGLRPAFQVLSILLQNSTENQRKVASDQSNIDRLLRTIAIYRKKDASSLLGDEVELILNIFACLASIMLVRYCELHVHGQYISIKKTLAWLGKYNKVER